KSDKMNAKIKGGYELTKIFSAVSNIIDEATLNFKPSGLEIKELDNSGISMIEITLKPSLLNEYIINNEFKAGVNIANLNKLLKSIDKNEELTLSVENDTISVKTEHKVFSVHIIEAKGNNATVKEQEYTNVITINASEFKKTLKALKEINNYAHFYVSNGVLKIQAEGDAGSFANEFNNVVNKSTEPINNATFNIEYIQKLTKEADNKSNIELYLKQGEPLKLVYEIAGHKIRGFLAPYVEE
ncbi:MAG: hypothetical protein QW478_04740, partial [Candidatus Micrarchaeaceae archaeon]